MKKSILSATLALAMLLCTACASRTQPAETPPETQPGTEQTTEQPTGQTTETEPEAAPADDGLAPYAAVLNETCDVVINGWRDPDGYEQVCSGVMEASNGSDLDRDMLDVFGYALTDLTGDGEPELLIVSTDGLVLGGYAVADGEVVRFLDGWSRNRYQLLDDGRFYNEGSGGAAYSIFGVYHISADGTALECEDYYFTDLKQGDEDVIVPYHNTTGEWDPENSELFRGSERQFWARAEELSANAVTPDMIPLSNLLDSRYTGPVNQPMDCKVRVDYEEDVGWKLEHVKAVEDEFPALAPAGAAGEVRLVFRCAEDVRDFKLLRLQLLAVDDMGNPTFKATELCALPTLSADEPLSATLGFPGDMPSYGFSYLENGEELQFSVGQSGRDGAIVVNPISAS